MMNPMIKNLTIAAALFTMTVTLATVGPNSTALAQIAAPSEAGPLPATTVKALQEALNKQGIAVKADGVFGDDTGVAIRQYQSQHHLPVTGEPDKATLDKLGVAGQRSDLPTGSPAAGVAMPGQSMGAGPGGQGMMGMMTPQMMQMMQRMMGQGGMPGMMGGMQGEGMPEVGMGPGMMGQIPMMGDMSMCPMMQMMGKRSGMGMHSMMGAAMLYGMPHATPEEMTPERVRTLLEQHLEQHGNPRLKLGEIASAADGSITVEIVTVDGSLVQKLAFNRYPGLFRQVK